MSIARFEVDNGSSGQQNLRNGTVVAFNGKVEGRVGFVVSSIVDIEALHNKKLNDLEVPSVSGPV